MSLTRADLEARRFQQLMEKARLKVSVLSDEELQQSMVQVLGERPGQEVWVFAYGSLIWNPIIHFVEQRVGTALGWHRQFCLWTPMGRGTPENPGLVLGLEEGKTCQGLVYRIAPELVEAELLLLWRREMIVGSYIPHWLTVETMQGSVEAIAFTINRTHRMYAGPLPDEVIVRHIATAQGNLGSCSDYLKQTLEGLQSAGIIDEHLLHLYQSVVAFTPQNFQKTP